MWRLAATSREQAVIAGTRSADLCPTESSFLQRGSSMTGFCDWRRLKIGDAVRLIEWPMELRRDWLHLETQELYDWLIESGTVVVVSEIDDSGLPYCNVQRTIDGVQWREWLALNHGGIELVLCRASE